jgi:hypothetical protein
MAEITLLQERDLTFYYFEGGGGLNKLEKQVITRTDN